MKRRDFIAIKIKNAAELETELKGSLEKLRVLQFNLALGKVKNQKEIHEVKRTIAQLRTLLKSGTERVK